MVVASAPGGQAPPRTEQRPLRAVPARWPFSANSASARAAEGEVEAAAAGGGMCAVGKRRHAVEDQA